MYHADLAAGLAGRLTGKPPIVWGLHHTVSDKNSLKATTNSGCADQCRPFAFYPGKSCMLCRSDAFIPISHWDMRLAKMMVIPNGIDPAIFLPDPAARRDVRHELGLEDGTPLIGSMRPF